MEQLSDQLSNRLRTVISGKCGLSKWHRASAVPNQHLAISGSPCQMDVRFAFFTDADADRRIAFGANAGIGLGRAHVVATGGDVQEFVLALVVRFRGAL